MADMTQLPTLEQAQKLRDKGTMPEEQYKQIEALYAPETKKAVEADIRSQLSNPLFAPTDGSGAMPEDQIKQEVLNRTEGRAQGIVDKALAGEQRAVDQQNATEAMQSRYGKPVENIAQTGSAVPQEIPAAIARPVSLTTDLPITPRGEGVPSQPNLYGQMMANLTKPYEMEQAAIQQGAMVGAARGAEEFAMRKKTYEEDRRMIDANVAARQERDAKVAEQQSLLNKKVEEVSNLKVDPKNLWSNLGTGEKVLAGIALALGAAGSGGNKAAAVLQNAIERDIDAQKANIGTKKGEISDQRGILHDMISTFRNQDVAEDATRVAYYGNMQQQIQATASKYSSPEIKAKAMGLMAEIEQKKQMAQMSFMQNMQKMMPQNISGNTDPRMLSPEMQEKFVPGMGMALSKDDAKDLKAYNTDYANAKSNIKDLVSLSNESGASLSPELRTKAESTARMLQAALRTQVLGPGTVNEGERQMLEAIAVNPTAIFSMGSRNRAALNTLQNILDQNYQNKAKAYGLQTPEQSIGLRKVSTN